MKSIRKLVREAGGDESLADMLENLGKLQAAIAEYDEAAYIQIPLGEGVSSFSDVTVETNRESLNARHALAGRHLKLVILLLEKVRERWNRMNVRDEKVMRAVMQAQAEQEPKKKLVAGVGSHEWDLEASSGDMQWGVTRCKKCGIIASRETDIMTCQG